MKKAANIFLVCAAFCTLVLLNNQSMDESTQEIWKDVVGYEGYYQVSNLGRVKSMSRKVKSPLRNNTVVTKREKILKQGKNKLGYRSVTLQRDTHIKCISVHRLVASVFIKNPLKLPVVAHNDSDPSNNIVDNLRWTTQSDNIQQAFNEGRKVVSSISSFKKGVPSKNRKKVNQYSLDNLLLRNWDCITDIQNQTGFNRPNICKALKGKISSAYGYKWKYS